MQLLHKFLILLQNLQYLHENQLKKAKIETHPVTAETRISKCSI